MHKRDEWILGVDGGGSKTIACVATVPVGCQDRIASMVVRGMGESGPGNPRSVGFAAAYESIISAIRHAMEDAVSKDPTVRVGAGSNGSLGNAVDCVDAVCLCLAGVGREEEQRPVLEWAYQNRLGNRVRVTEDVAPIRWAAMYESAIGGVAAPSPPLMQTSSRPTGGGVENAWDQCVTLIAGTGSIVSASNGVARDLRVGGWGYLLGDEGSGFAMGLAGLKEVCRAHDHGESLTPFHRMMLHAIGCEYPMELIPRVYTVPIPRPDIATLNRIVLDFAERDPVALKIVDHAAIELSNLVMTAARRMSLAADRYALAMSGGMLADGSPLVPAVLTKLSEAGMKPAMCHQVRQPVMGALAMAACLGREQDSNSV
jgi:N-acetylmuramic acid 6-phosphate etherase